MKTFVNKIIFHFPYLARGPANKALIAAPIEHTVVIEATQKLALLWSGSTI